MNMDLCSMKLVLLVNPTRNGQQIWL